MNFEQLMTTTGCDRIRRCGWSMALKRRTSDEDTSLRVPQRPLTCSEGWHHLSVCLHWQTAAPEWSSWPLSRPRNPDPWMHSTWACREKNNYNTRSSTMQPVHATVWYRSVHQFMTQCTISTMFFTAQSKSQKRYFNGRKVKWPCERQC